MIRCQKSLNGKYELGVVNPQGVYSHWYATELTLQELEQTLQGQGFSQEVCDAVKNLVLTQTVFVPLPQ